MISPESQEIAQQAEWLYEHRLKDPARALHHVRSGTTETEAATEHRKHRLERKAARATQRELPLPRAKRP